MRRMVLLFLVIAMPLLALTRMPEAHAQGQRCFPETNYCIEGPIRTYWEQNGGLSVFGYPITEQRVETVEGWTGPVQWFERDRLEDHGDQGVMAGRLGAKILELENQPWHTFPQVNSAPAGCSFFPETGHSLCEPFNVYWQNNGGVERFGYPITEPFQTTIDGWTGTVQYFERRRMEHHPENRGTQYEILLGLLGKEVLHFGEAGAGASCDSSVLPELESAYSRVQFAEQMGCPSEVYRDVPAAIQNMEHGVMLWVYYNESDQDIYAIWSYGRYQAYPDTWTEDMPDRPDVSPPSGLFAPIRGFGKVWTDHPTVRSELGWAVDEHEREEMATVQMFDSGGRMVWLKGSDTVYVLGPEEWTSQILPRQEP